MQNRNTSASHDSEWASIRAARQQMEQSSPPNLMSEFLPLHELSESRQKAIRALQAKLHRAEQTMNDAQVDHGTQSPQWAEASAKYAEASDMLTRQIQRTQLVSHPLYVSEKSATEYHAALETCPSCGTPLGVSPLDGKLGCPHIACCYLA